MTIKTNPVPSWKLTNGKKNIKIWMIDIPYYVSQEYSFYQRRKCSCNDGIIDNCICPDCEGKGYKESLKYIYRPKKIYIKKIEISSHGIHYHCDDDVIRAGYEIYDNIKDVIDAVDYDNKHRT